MNVSERLGRVAAARELARTGMGRVIRERHNLSLSDIAQELGTSPSQVSYWERGIRLPRGQRGIAWGQLMLQLMASGPLELRRGRGS